MAAQYDKVPSGCKLQVTPFQANIPDARLDELKTLVRLSRLAPQTWESSQQDRKYGVTSDWMAAAKEQWEADFDWRKHEAHINSFPNFKTSIKDDDGRSYELHFVALFSGKPDAIPILFLHGWPGNFLEFLDLVSLLAKKYTPATLPYHVIVPSLPGYTFSSGPPVDRDWTDVDSARLLDKLATGLGFTNGYISQGGDIGSRLSRILSQTYDNCKVVLENFDRTDITDEEVNFNMMTAPPADNLPVNDIERKALDERWTPFRARGMAYALEHATRPSTIGHALTASPLALLAWVGEKLLEWTDRDPSIDTILGSVTLWWLTDTMPRAIYSYRGLASGGTDTRPGEHHPSQFIHKPLGFTWLPQELGPVPRSWIEKTGNLVFFRQHTQGGHFAAMEVPAILLQDVEDFVAQVWTEA